MPGAVWSAASAESPWSPPKSVLVLILGLLLATVGSGCSGDAQSSREGPNVVLIYADDVGYGDLGSYGATKISTPHLDTLARQGVRFTDAYATASTCTPSRYSLLTGRYAFRKEEASILPGDAPLVIDTSRATLASVFQKEGYATGVVGKWHLGLGTGAVNWNERIAPGPLELGFDRSFIMPSTNDRVPTVYVKGRHVQNLSAEDPPLRVSYDEKIGTLPTGESHPERLRYPADAQHSGTIVDSISRIGWMSGGQSAWWEEGEIAPTFVRRARTFVEGHQDRPFFLYLSLRDVHMPRWPNAQFRGESESGLRGDAMEEADWVVGQMMATLRTLDLKEETIVIFTSDNGPVYDDGYEDGAIEDANGHVANGPLRGGKYQSFEGGTRVPFIVRWPGEAKAGVTSDAIISQVDLLATLADLAGLSLSQSAGPDSRALPEVLLGKSEDGRSHVVQQGTGKLALRRGPWKYIPDGPYPEFAFAKHNDPKSPIATPMPPADQALLFNLAEDPDESENRIEEHPEIAQELAAQLDSLRSRPGEQ
jgi:arylsulfatase A-like enzyme